MKTLTPQVKARYFRRQATDLIMGGLCVFAAVIGLIMLALILWMLFSRGLAGLSLDVFTKSMSSTGTGGGLANAIVGSLIQVGIGSMIGAPLGMMVGVYLSEVGKTSRFASLVRFVNDILLSAPSVLIGLFVYQIAVSPFGGFSGIAGAIFDSHEALPTGERVSLTPEQTAARKRRGQWLAIALFAFVILVFVLTMTKIGANILVRDL